MGAVTMARRVLTWTAKPVAAVVRDNQKTVRQKETITTNNKLTAEFSADRGDRQDCS
jgi:hypothetical protein